MIDAALAYIPPYYRTSAVAEAIIGAHDIELNTIDVNNKDLRDQLYVSSATWGLEYWENDLNIETILTDTYEVRRGRITAKQLGQGQFNHITIQSICDSYGVGLVDTVVVGYTATITFLETRGEVPGADSILEEIYNLIDAHMEVVLAFTYLTWDEWEAAGLTWDEFDALGMTWDEFEVWDPTI